jgi:hypothetical protein
MRVLSNNFTRLHCYVAGALYLIFALLSIYCCLRLSVPSGVTVIAALATFSGPFTAGLVHPPAMQFALSTLPFFAAFIGLGSLFQVLRLPIGRGDGARVFYILTWMFGLLVWFGGAILSLICAFD